MSRGIIWAIVAAIVIVAGILAYNHLNSSEGMAETPVDETQAALSLQDVLPAGYDMAIYDGMDADTARALVQGQIDAGVLPAEAMDLIMESLGF